MCRVEFERVVRPPKFDIDHRILMGVGYVYVHRICTQFGCTEVRFLYEAERLGCVEKLEDVIDCKLVSCSDAYFFEGLFPILTQGVATQVVIVMFTCNFGDLPNLTFSF